MQNDLDMDIVRSKESFYKQTSNVQIIEFV